MPKLSTVNITVPQKKELDQVKDFLREQYNVNPSYVDAIAHLLRFWQQKRKQNGAVQESLTSSKE